MLAESTSIFPALLAAYWHTKDIESMIVTMRPDAPDRLPDGTRVIRSSDYETRTMRGTVRVTSPLLYRLERTVPYFKKRFTRRTGVSGDTELWLPYFASYAINAWPLARAALAQQPRFVFGHEVLTYGPATALCRGVPRIIFPWGADVFTYAESSPYHSALVKFSLRAADLIVPSSTTAARHICDRFRIPSEKVHAVSWGVDREQFRKADPERRRSICERWNIDPRAKIFLNVRRFNPAWGSTVALEAFMRLAQKDQSTHFIMFGGLMSERFMLPAKESLRKAGLLHRFTLLEGDWPIDDCADLMSVSDVFVSLLGHGDMRSASVLQATACGGLPVLSDIAEYREMERLGFNALFVRPDSVEDVLSALSFCLQNPDQAKQMADNNQAYIARHEDHRQQMDHLLELIDAVCAKY